MTNQEYINEHPEKFIDDIDKWLFTEFSIIGGCCSAQGSMEYSVARMVTERLFKAQGNRTYYECMDKVKKQWLDKACEWLEDNKDNPFIGCEDPCLSGYLTDQFIADFRNYMKGE